MSRVRASGRGEAAWACEAMCFSTLGPLTLRCPGAAATAAAASSPAWVCLGSFCCENTRVLRNIRRADCENTKVLRALIAFNWRVDCENTRVLRALIAVSLRIDCENTRALRAWIPLRSQQLISTDKFNNLAQQISTTDLNR